ncbi:MAG TPA: DUF488 family protein [Terrimicrobiaceae bacterium]
MKPRISTYRYGSPRQTNEGLRLGVARHVPRGIRREDWQSGGYFDQWVPLLAPTSDLVAKYRQKKVRFATFTRLYQNQMKAPASRQVIDLLATISLFLPISIGCYCEDESLCHRSVLRKLILKAAESKTGVFESFLEMRESGDLAKFASPVCFRDLEEE